MSTRRSFHNHSSPNYQYVNHQQRGYNPRNMPRRPNYQPSRQHHNVHNNPHVNYSWFGGSGSYTATENLVDIVNNHSPYYEQIDDDYVATDLTQLINQERYPRFNLGSPVYSVPFYRLDDTYDHDHEEKEDDDDDDVLKYLKIRTHHAPAKDGVDPKVESEICAICLTEFKENIGTLQCGHEYHTDCIKQWLLKKKDCPMCRASVLPL